MAGADADHPEHVRLARSAWDVVRGGDPRALARTAATPDERLPYLAPALRRLLEELPGTRDGLGRTRAPAARGGRRRRAHAEQAFLASMAAEERRSWATRSRSTGSTSSRTGLVSGNGGLELARRAGATCSPAAPIASRSVGFDRWLGGLHVTAPRTRCGAGTRNEAAPTR